MISAALVFTVLMILFVLFGAVRGWQREVVAGSSVVLALFALQTLGMHDVIIRIADAVYTPVADPASSYTVLERAQIGRFIALAVAFLGCTFFGYLGPTVKHNLVGGHHGDRGRIGLQNTMLGMIVGVANGWLVLSTVAHLAYKHGLLTDPGQFPATGTPLFVPPPEGWQKFFFVQSSAYVVLVGPLLNYVLVVLFFLIIVILI